MANRGEEKGKDGDFYRVLGLNKECSPAELKNAYKKLALRWHPDRCSASGNSKFLDEAKKKFQDIQQAYSVLSDTNKRFLYDVGIYDSDDDENGMGDFLNEMAVMMTQTKPNENGKETIEELQNLFEEMFQDEMDSFEASCQPAATSSSSSTYMSYSGSPSISNKRNSFEMSMGGKPKVEDSFCSELHFQKFSLGVEHRQDFKKGKGAKGGTQRVGEGRHRNNRNGKAPSGYHVSSSDFGVSAS